MKKLLSILGSIGLAGTASATVISCGNTGNKEDYRSALQSELTRAENTKTTIEEQNKELWGGVAESSQKDFATAIIEAREALNKEDLTKEAAQEQISKLGVAIDAFVSAVPANIIAEVINNQPDITDIVDRDWTYSSFFNMNGEKDIDGQPRILDLFYGHVRDSAKSHHYTEEEADALHRLVFDWSKQNINLVYINVDDQGEQKIANKFVGVDSGAKVEDLFKSSVQQEFPNEDLNSPEFWQNHPKLSLGISFEKTLTGRELPLRTKDFWTFTFKTN